MSDEELVRRIREGDTALFEVVMRRYNQRLYRAARAIVKDDAEAEDVIQQAYVNAYLHLDQFEHRAKLSTWLTRIAVHEALARVRKAARTSTLDDPDRPGEMTMAALTSQGQDPERTAYSRELASVLESAIAALPEDFRTVFVLRDVEGLSTLETAESLGVREDTVKTRLHRARAALRRHLTAQVGASASSAYAFQAPRCDRVVARVMAQLQQLGLAARSAG